MPRTDRPVLVVDDDPDMREALKDTLASEGYRTELAGDGQEALDYIRSKPMPSVILLDWNMAPMSGPQFMVELAKERATVAAIPVVLVTADARERRRRSAIRSWRFSQSPLISTRSSTLSLGTRSEQRNTRTGVTSGSVGSVTVGDPSCRVRSRRVKGPFLGRSWGRARARRSPAPLEPG